MKNVALLSILALAAAIPGYAGPVTGPMLTLDPLSGNVQGPPGSIVGWGFTLTSDPVSWISVVTTALIDETNPGLGIYTDFAGLLGGPVNAVLAPAAPAWSLAFDAANQLGVGAYNIDGNAVVGASDGGILDLNYEAFSADPNLCPNCATGFFDLDVPFQVQVVAPEGAQAAPEPAVGWLLVLVLPLMWRARKVRSRRAWTRLSARACRWRSS